MVIIKSNWKKEEKLQGLYMDKELCSLNAGCKLNVENTSRGGHGCFLKILCTFNIFRLSRGSIQKFINNQPNPYSGPKPYPET